jgi:hypothetical protein
LSDLQLTTFVNPNIESVPPQQPGVSTYFSDGMNDLQIDSSNDFALVSGLSETTQDVQKILMTEQGTNVIFPLYGTTLQGLIGNKTNINSASGQIQDQITTALQILFLLTQNRANSAEIVQTLYSLQTSMQSETNISALLTVISASGQEITTGISIGNI